MRVLLVGNTGYITKEFVQEAFPESRSIYNGEFLVEDRAEKAFERAPFPERDEELETFSTLMILNLWFIFLIYITFHGTNGR